MKSFLFSGLILVLSWPAFGAETPAEIEGALIQRPDGSFMEFVLVENRIVCNFFDSQKQSIDPDVDRVAVRMKRRQPKVRNVFAVAVPFDGIKGLRAPIFIEIPQLFTAYVSLMQEGINDPVEFYMVRYPDDLTAPAPITIFEGEDPDRPKTPGY